MSTTRDWYIYTLADPRNQAVRYVGWCFDTKRRMVQHWNDCVSKHTYRARWMLGLRQRGLMPILSVVETGTGDWDQAERRWIAHYRSLGCKLTNMTDGGEGSPGLRPSLETRAKMAASQRGKKRTTESVAKSRAGLLGRKKTEAHRANMSRVRKGIIPVGLTEAAARVNRGRKHSPEHIARRTKSHIGKIGIGRKLTDEQVQIIRASRGEVSQRALAERYGVSVSTIHYAQSSHRYRMNPST